MGEFLANVKAVLDMSGIQSQINDIASIPIKFTNVSIDPGSMQKAIQTALASGVGSNVSKGIGNAINDGIRLGAAQSQKSFTSYGKTYQKAIDDVLTGGVRATISKSEIQYKRLGQITGAYAQQAERSFASLKSFQEKLTPEKIAGMSEDDFNNLYGGYSNALKTFQNDLSVLKSQGVSALDYQKFDTKITKWLNDNTKAAKEFGGAMESVQQKAKALYQSGQLDQLAMLDLEGDVKSIDLAATAAGKKGKSLFEQIKSAGKQMLGFISAYDVIQTAVRGFREMYQAVYDVDTAMTELKKVTDESASSYEKYIGNAKTAAKEIGTSVSDYINSTADFARLGHNFADSQELAKVASVYNVVGDELSGIDQATGNIVSTMAAFGVTTNDAMSIVDKFNAVSNSFSISSGGIGDAMSRSASSLAAANSTIDESIALITAANLVGRLCSNT